MADRFFQGYIYQLQGSIYRTFGVIDNKEIVSCSNQELIGVKNSFNLMEQHTEENKCFIIKDKTYSIFYDSRFVRFAVFVEGKDKVAEDFVTILSVCFNGMKIYFEEKYNRQFFYKALFLENIMTEDISVRAKMLKVPLSMVRTVLVMRFKRVDPDWNLAVLFQNMDDSDKYEVFSMTETDIIVIAKVKQNASHADIEDIGLMLQNRAAEVFQASPVVGVGRSVQDIRQLSDSYKEALYVLELLYLFEGKRTVLDYNHLGINRIIYQLPIPLCQSYLKEVFIKGGFDTLENETLETVNCFFANNLNVSETARKLFIHRNTLAYRLEKVRKLTGLDVRIFDHAIIFKLAMTIYIHMRYKA